MSGRSLPVFAKFAAVAIVLLAAVVTAYEPTSAATVIDRLVVPNVWAGHPNSPDIYVQNAGDAPAIVYAKFHENQGIEMGELLEAGPIPPGATAVIAASNFFPLSPEGMVGTVILASDQPIAAMKVGHNFGGLAASRAHELQDKTIGTYVAKTEVTVPYVANNLEGQYDTQISVVNNGLGAACLQLTYSFVAGQGSVPDSGRPPLLDAPTAYGFPCEQSGGYPLRARGQLLIVPSYFNRPAPPANPGGPPIAPTVITMPSATDDALMSLTITSTGSDITVEVQANQTGINKLGTYEGFVSALPGYPEPATGPDAGTELAVPFALKTDDGYYTQILLSNPNDVATTATITYDGNTGPHVATVELGANGVGNHSVYTDDIVPVGFIGAATVTADVPIAAVVFRAKMTTAFSFVDEPIYTAVNALPVERAATRVAIPLVTRRIGAGPGDGINSWVAVIAPSGSANVTVTTVGNKCGAAEPTTYVTTKDIDGSFIFYQNAETDNGFTENEGDSPACFSGAMVIESDQPVIALASRIADIPSSPPEREGVFGGSHGLPITDETGSVRIRVLLDGEPLAGVCVLLINGNGNDPVTNSVTTGADGAAVFTDVPAGITVLPLPGTTGEVTIGQRLPPTYDRTSCFYAEGEGGKPLWVSTFPSVQVAAGVEQSRDFLVSRCAAASPDGKFCTQPVEE